MNSLPKSQGRRLVSDNCLESTGHRRAQWGTAAPSHTLSPEPAESPSVASSRFLSPVSKVPGSSCLSFSLGAHPGISSFHNTYLLQVPTCPPLSLCCAFEILSFLSNMSFFYSISLSASLSSSHVLWEAFVNSFGWLRDNFSTVTVVFIQFNQ